VNGVQTNGVAITGGWLILNDAEVSETFMATVVPEPVSIGQLLIGTTSFIINRRRLPSNRV
jgi:hypothetical protein